MAACETDTGGRSEGFLVVAIKDAPNWLAGIDQYGSPCVLIKSAASDTRKLPSIKLENIFVHFHRSCHVNQHSEKSTEGIYNSLQLRTSEPDMRRIFFSICESVLAMLGENPDDTTLSKALRRIASMFAKLLENPSRKLSGLFGELVFINMAKDPSLCIAAWRNFDSDRYDFSTNHSKIEVKSSGMRRRSHEFSIEQCIAPEGAVGLVASIFVERSGSGSSIWDLCASIEGRLGQDYESVFKLRRITTETLGNAQKHASDVFFDLSLAEQSLQYFRFADIPTISPDIPVGVSKVRFLSDLSIIPTVEPIDVGLEKEISMMMKHS